MAAAASPKNHEHLADAAVHFLPPAGEGGIRRSPARRMTEEGEPYRLLTAKSDAFLTAACHFHGAVPSSSPSPAALVGGTLPRWGRERTAADAPDVVPCHGCSCAERASPFSTMGRGTAANAPGVGNWIWCCCVGRRVGTPYDRVGSDSPDLVRCRGCCCAERRGRRSLPGLCGFAGGGTLPLAAAAGMSGTPSPTNGRLRLIETGCLTPVGAGVLDGPAVCAPVFVKRRANPHAVTDSPNVVPCRGYVLRGCAEGNDSRIFGRRDWGAEIGYFETAGQKRPKTSSTPCLGTASGGKRAQIGGSERVPGKLA